MRRTTSSVSCLPPAGAMWSIVALTMLLAIGASFAWYAWHIYAGANGIHTSPTSVITNFLARS